MYFYAVESKNQRIIKYLLADDKVRSLILNHININPLMSKYHDAYKLFKEKIYYDGFNPIINISEVLDIRNGLYIYSQLDNRNKHKSELESYGLDFTYHKRVKEVEKEDIKKIILISTEYTTLKILVEFYLLAGKVKCHKEGKIFSPEEEVFKPYVLYLGRVYNNIVDTDYLSQKLFSALGQYSQEAYDYCVSIVGLITEDILIQIYETFIRETCPRRLTLGQILQEIENRTSINTGSDGVQIAPPIDELYQKIELLNKQKKVTSKEVLVVVRDSVTSILQNTKYTKHLIDEVKNSNKAQTAASIFPRNIRQNLTELKVNRDATSHKSQLRVGQYEALRSLYCCVTLIKWWQDEKEIIDWQDTLEGIIEKAIARNSPSTS